MQELHNVSQQGKRGLVICFNHLLARTVAEDVLRKQRGARLEAYLTIGLMTLITLLIEREIESEKLL